jgi:ATP-dependent Clp protease ATP-binding subunit ClpB
VDDEHDEQTKQHYTFPYGNFKKVHRSGVLSAESRAGENAGAARQEIQDNLSRSATVALGDQGQHAAPNAPGGTKLSVSKWAVCHQGDFSVSAVGQQASLDVASLEVIENLICRQPLVAQSVLDCRQLLHVEIALVDEPSVEDTISILRGLRERYEVHHGVRIKDAALVTAAVLSHRYITERFLPDKAIDLVDEAAAKLRTEIESMPTELDEVSRRVMQLEIEREALRKESDAASRERLAKLEKELADLKAEQQQLRARWETEKQAIQRLRSLKEEIEKVKQAVEQAQREYDLNRAAELKYGKLAQLERQLVDEEKRLHEQGNMQLIKEEVDEDDIAAVVARWTGIPVSRLLEGEKDKLLRLAEHLHKRVVGQDEAVDAVADAVIRARSGLKDPNRPIGSFIFLGPTGVGKTELARALAEFMFDDEKNMIRIDMSEYQERHTVARLIGAPPGYVGYDEGGQLTEAVRRRPYSVILFDEIEKAHGDVFNVMLQILDDGRLTDGHGRTVDFKNTVVIMTSNVGSHLILAYRGGDDPESFEEMKKEVLGVLRQQFRPEFLNRVDEIVVFHSLSRAQLKQIVEIQLERLRARLAERHIVLELTDEAREYLAAVGYDPQYGARPLKRAIQKELETPLGKLLLKGEVSDGQKVLVDREGARGALKFVVQPGEGANRDAAAAA